MVLSKNVYFFVTYIVVSYTAIDDPCLLETNGHGICKLLLECQKVRDDVVNLQRLPQTCGFKETHPIVCCPKDDEHSRQPGVISKIKCKEYSELTSGGAKHECGHKIYKRGVVGGTAASRKEFPHMAILGCQRDEGVFIWWICGGTLISEKYVVTAALCLDDNSLFGEVKYVKIGLTNLNDNDHKQEFKVVERIKHPDYNPKYAYNDIGLVKLDKAVKFNEYVKPACLYTNNDVSPEKGVVTGWGHILELPYTNDLLLKVTLNITDCDSCNVSYKNSGRRFIYGIDKDSQLCTGSVGKGKCGGDRGGPVQIYHEGDNISCMHDLVGVTTLIACMNPCGVYTSVAHFIKWIEDIVWPISSS